MGAAATPGVQTIDVEGKIPGGIDGCPNHNNRNNNKINEKKRKTRVPTTPMIKRGGGRRKY